MKKLILEEDDIQEIEQTEELPEVVEDDSLVITNLISTLIKNAWDSVDLYNSMLITLNDIGNQEAIDTINDIINGLYINIGQLENVLQNANSQAQAIDLEEPIDAPEVDI